MDGINTVSEYIGIAIMDKTDDYIKMRGEAILKWFDGKKIQFYDS